MRRDYHDYGVLPNRAGEEKRKRTVQQDVIDCYRADLDRLRAELEKSEVRVRELEDTLASIRQYGADTLSGPVIRSHNTRDWQREAVRVMTRRAREALANNSGKWGVHTSDVLADTEFIRGAQFGWNCGIKEDRERLNKAIQSRIDERTDLANSEKEG